MGRIRDLFKVLSTNANVASEEEYEEVQEELEKFLQANGESENRITNLEKGLDTHKRAELKEELKATANAKEAVVKTRRKNNKVIKKEEQER